MFSKTVDTIRTKYSTVILNYIEVLWKTSYDSNEIFCSHFTLCKGPMCAMSSRPYGWYLRTIAKTDQESANSELFHFLFKNCRNDSTETFYNHFTPCGEPMCAMTMISYCRDLRNTAESDQIRANCELFRFCLIRSTRIEQTFLQSF